MGPLVMLWERVRRGLKLAWWRLTEQLIRLARALFPYYQRHASSHLKPLLPRRMRRALRRRLFKELERAPDPVKAQQAEAAAEGILRFNTSVERRLSDMSDYKAQIAGYIAARRARTSQPDAHPRVAIYTAISQDYDSIKLPDQLDPRLDYVLFTDRPTPDTGIWRVRPITYFHEDPTRAARFVKTHPHMLLPEYDLAIWMDANIMLVGDVRPLVEDFLASGKAVGAVPHPLRKSIYQEVEACITRKKEDPQTLQEQADRYQQAGFDHDDLIESSLIMFNLQLDRIRPFLDTWWSEIDRYSRRDQLSLNYALAHHGLDWHRLIQHPDCVRNHAAFALVPHHLRGGPETRLIDALGAPYIDPYAGLPYAGIREQRVAAQQSRRIDIVVCVHNALHEVKLCLESVARARQSDRHRLIIIDDGSDSATAGYLQDFARGRSWVELRRNEQALGYTRAANQGLAASTGDFVILLNSDTTVTVGWAEKMADAVFSTPGAGIAGPVSNAASHQSIPDHHGSLMQTAINELPPGLSAEDMDRYCEQWTVVHVLPRVPLVHGFCLGITREVINRIGLFDEDSFPRGYGEENDYCFRAIDAGFSLVIATHTFVYHAKSSSYGDTQRAALARAGSQALTEIHGRPRVRRAVASMQENPILEGLRERARAVYPPGTLPSPHFPFTLRKAYTYLGGMGRVWKRRRNA